MYYDDPKKVAEFSEGIGEPMVGVGNLKADPVKFASREGGNMNE